MQRTARDRQEYKKCKACIGAYGRDKTHDGGRLKNNERTEDASLTKSIGEATGQRAHEGRADGENAGENPGESVRTLGNADEQHHSETFHGDRKSTHQPGHAKSKGAWSTKYVDVRPEHALRLAAWRPAAARCAMMGG